MQNQVKQSLRFATTKTMTVMEALTRDFLENVSQELHPPKAKGYANPALKPAPEDSGCRAVGK